jgi:hypothetical protein
MSEVMLDGGTAIQKLLADRSSSDEIDVAEAALGKLYCDFIASEKSLLESEFRSDQNEAILTQTEQQCKSMQIRLPKELLDANRAVRPDRLQALYDYFNHQPDLLALVPLKPGTAGSNQRMEAIIQILEEQLAGVKNESYVFYKWLAIQWIYNTPLRKILADRIHWLRRHHDERPPSTIIRELLRTLEKNIRFRLVKYYMAYTSILEFALRQDGKNEVADSMEPFHVYLECGASDRVALNLIALGLSRVTALALRNNVAFPEEVSPEECLDILSRMKIENIGIPRLCIREVLNLLGK